MEELLISKIASAFGGSLLKTLRAYPLLVSHFVKAVRSTAPTSYASKRGSPRPLYNGISAATHQLNSYDGRVVSGRILAASGSDR